MDSITDNYLNVQQDIPETFVDRHQLKALTAPTILPGGKRIPGLKLDHPRQLALMHALVRFANVAASKLGGARRSQLDCLYARVASSLDKLLQAVGLKKAA
jgi:hypothetical protein